MPSVYGALDLQKNELRQAQVQNLASAPGTPVKGQLWFDSTNNILKWWDGGQWIAAQGGAGAVPGDTVTTQAIGDAAVAGSSGSYSRADHKHAMPAFGASTAETSFGTSKADGSAATVARSDHTHGNPAHDAAAHSGIPLNSYAVPTGSLSLNSQKITSLADGTVATDGVNLGQVQNLVAGLSWKAPVVAATTANITLSAPQTIDGIGVVANDRVLVKNQSTNTQNGIYTVAAGAWVRATDADVTAELNNAAVFVQTGTTLADTAWVQTFSPLVLGTSAVTFVQFSGAGTYTGGTGITLTGNSFSIDDSVVATDAQVTTAISNHAGAADPHTGYQLESEKGTGNGYAGLSAGLVPIAQLPTGTTGTTVSLGNHNHTGVYTAVGTTVTAGNGLTGGGDLSTNRTFDVVAGDTSLTVAADNVIVNTSVIATRAYADAVVPVGMARKYAGALGGSASPETVTHNLNTRDIQLQVLNGSTPYTAVEVDWDATTVNTAVIRYAPNLGAGYRVVVMG